MLTGRKFEILFLLGFPLSSGTTRAIFAKSGKVLGKLMTVFVGICFYYLLILALMLSLGKTNDCFCWNLFLLFATSRL